MTPLEQVKTRTQACPLCKQEQDIIFMGHFPSPEYPDQVIFSQTNGYSFCNCRNIYYTAWDNMRQGVYNPDYHKKYDHEGLRELYLNMVQFYSNYIHLPSKGSVLEIGAIGTPILDYFKIMGMNTTGLDIHDHPLGDHKLIVSDIEKFEPQEKFDLVWASHVFEHLRDPIAVVKKCNEVLNDNGYLFIAMPDPYFIDLNQPDRFGHWHLNEHHIIWEMESFCEVLRENGFEIVLKHHNTSTDFICNLDMGIIAKKRIDVKHYS